ncbi:MAG: hypothetical protein M3O82_01535 [Verrucomicrobiota bacterium]|nr:hypothetical protein [Verrucomicrobiota bacterium]
MTSSRTVGIADLSDRAKFALSGGDRVRFLNGQISNDIRKADAHLALHACVLTPKGKMCGDIFVSATDDALRCDAEPALCETLAARLERYIIADDVVLRDVTDEFKLLHAIGIGSEEIDEAGLGGIASVAANRFGTTGADFWLDAETFGKAWTSLSARTGVFDSDALEVLRISAGIPRWGFELSEDTIPNEAGLDKTSVDYEKGCYVGQEIISRLKSIGHVNKTLCGFISRDSRMVSRGARLFVIDAPTKEAGWVTSTAFSSALEKSIALGYLKRGVTASEFLAHHLETGEEWVVERASFPILS